MLSPTKGIKITSKGIVRAGETVTGVAEARMFQASRLRGTELATDALIDGVRSKGRIVNVAKPGSDSERLLDYFNANASVSGLRSENILLRPAARKIEVLEEFLHGTQRKIGISTGTADAAFAERHVKEFMIRHRKLLGLGDEDVGILQRMLRGE